ncbi:MAG: hypothetical protein AB7K09_03845 [Planctomycetota bacterium]
MKKFIAIMMVLGLVGFAVAQDLDTAQGDISTESQAGGAGGSEVYDLIISKMHEMEAKYIAHQTSEWEWIKWGYWIGAGNNSHRMNGQYDYGWAHSSDIHYEYWNQLSPAEFAAANAEFNSSWDRILAAGLN